MYHSLCSSEKVKKSAPKKKAPRIKWKGTLAGDTFQTLLPYLDIFSCGEWYQGSPHFSIPKAVKAQYANRFDYDRPDEIAKKYHVGKLTPKRIQRGIELDDQYFTCNKGCASSLSLLYLDLDDHLPHQKDKARLTQAVLNFVGSDNLFVNEGRLWLKGDWKESDYPQFKNAYTVFINALDSWAVARGFDTNVDLPKGFNQLGRLPLKNWNYDRLETFRQTRHVTVEMLKEWTRRLKEDTNRLPSDLSNAKTEATVTVVHEPLLEMPMPSIIEEAIDGDNPDCGDAPLRSASRSTTPLRSVTEQATPKKRTKPTVNICRSLEGMPLTEDEIEDIPAKIKRYKSLSYRCMEAAEKHKPKGQRLYSLDIQYASTILDFHFKYANENYGAPAKRAKAWWNWMVAEGYFTRGWCGKKWAAIHRILVDCGILNVIDNRYWFYAEGGKPGKSQQYHMKEEYLAVAHEGGEASIEEVKIDYIHRRCRPCLVSVPERQPDYWSSPHWRQKLDEMLYEAAA